MLCYTHERRNGWEPVTGLRFSRVLGVASVVALLQIPLALAGGNADGKIDEVLRRCGIEDCFASITDSGHVGYEKPHPAIFEAALGETKASAAESLYVGDVYSVDYVGARNAGMQAVLFDVAGAYRDREFPRVESLAELEEWLKH